MFWLSVQGLKVARLFSLLKICVDTQGSKVSSTYWLSLQQLNRVAFWLSGVLKQRLLQVCTECIGYICKEPLNSFPHIHSYHKQMKEKLKEGYCQPLNLWTGSKALTTPKQDNLDSKKRSQIIKHFYYKLTKTK